jgi:hypothetical protein
LRAEELESRLAPAITIRFDYSFDSSGFFASPDRQAALQRAADAIGPRLADNLAAIVPGGLNTWQASVFDPATNSTVTVPNPTIRANELVVYVAGAPLGSSELGLATTGGYSASGTRAWLDTVRARGQAGALATPKTDYSTWGGMITFDNRANWNFSTANPAVNQYDFTSVATHELMHILGFGLGEPAFTRNIVNGQFVGPAVEAVAGGPVPVTDNPPDHWAPGTNWNGQPSPMQPALPAGERRTMTPLDYAALEDIGWDLTSVAAPSPAPVAAAPAPVGAAVSAPLPGGRVAISAAGGVTVLGPGGQPVAAADPFGGTSPGGVRVATADVNGDGIPDLIAGTGPGRPALVTVVDGRTMTVLATFAPFEPGFAGGVFVAAGDFTGDGRADIVVTPDQSGGPVVAVYDGASAAAGQAVELTRFFGLADPNFRGGVRAAVGDVNGDGVPDLVVSAGPGGGPRVAVFDGRGIRARSAAPGTLTPDFFAFEPGLRNGAYVTVADLNGDGFGEVIAGAGPGGAPRVTAFDGRSLVLGARVAVADFFAGDPNSRGGVRVADADLNGDGQPDLVTGAGQGGQVNVYAAQNLVPNVTPPSWFAPVVPGNLPDGVYVG